MVKATQADIPAWLKLAEQVEYLFGPMSNEPSFHRSLQKNIVRGSALCVRDKYGKPGASLLGGLLYSTKPPNYKIGWLAVTQNQRRKGIGQQLFMELLNHIVVPATVEVTTFGPDNPAGASALRFYEQMGFQAAEAAPNGPEGRSRQIYRLHIAE